MVKKEYVIRYFDTIIRRYDAGHNHKEVSAWGGLVLELAFCAGVFRFALERQTGFPVLVCITVLLTAITVLIFRYVANQLEQKDINGAYASAAMLILAEILSEEGDSVDAKYVTMEKRIDGKFQSDVSLPKYLQQRKELLNLWGKGRRITRQMIFGLLVVAPIGTLVLLWLPRE